MTTRKLTTKMTGKMTPDASFGWTLALLVCSVSVASAQVYVNTSNKSPSPAQNAAAIVPQSSQNHLVTQTIYGFLDFTTTMGNTVMVFSPQSAPPVEAIATPKPVTIIDSNPNTQTNEVREINPSKPSNKESTNSETKQKLSNIVLPVPSGVPKKEIKKNNPKQLSTDSIKVVSKVEVVSGPSKVVEEKKPIVYSKVEVRQETNLIKDLPHKVEQPVIFSSRVEVLENIASETPQLEDFNIFEDNEDEDNNEDEEAAILVTNNNIGEPEFDFLSRQPSEVVEETYKVINLRPSKAHHKPKHASLKPRPNPQVPKATVDDEHPIGLVTTIGGTIVKDGLTTIHETSVIGTFISGKYAQVLHSKSQVLHGHKHKIAPTTPLKITKTAAPGILKNNRRLNLDPTPAASINEETVLAHNDNAFAKAARRQSQGASFKNNRHKQQETFDDEEELPSFLPSNPKHHGHRKPKHRPGHNPRPQSESAANSNRRYKSARNNGFKSTPSQVSNNDGYTRRFKPKVNASPVEADSAPASTSLYKFKLNRAPGRWQYKTSPKPPVTIRKILGAGNEDLQSTPSSNDGLQQNDVSPQSRSDSDLELSGSQNGPLLLDEDDDDNSIDKPPPVETLKVEISTASDFRDVYYEIATLKSPYTFQVGTVKNTRFITVTSTYEKSFEPTEIPSLQSSPTEPLTENILATTSPYDKDHNDLDSSIATLPAITLASDMETPPLETITDTFSTTQTMLKTHILPVIRNGDNATSYTLIQTYHITRLVTATKTLPPMEAYQFVPSKTLNEFNSRLDEAGSELHLELEFGDSNEQDEDGNFRRAFPPELDLANVGSDFDLSDVDKSRIPDNHLRHKKAHGPNNPKQQQLTEAPPPATPALTPEQAQQLAILRFLNPAAAAQIPNVITTSKPVTKIETIFESHVVPLYNGKSTIYSTISRAVSTVTKTEYEVGTSTLNALPLPPVNPLFQQQPQYQITSTPVVTQTDVTATESKVLKLTFGAKTTYTTLYSTRVVPTLLTTYVTQSIQVQPTAAFPGYYPNPYAPFPYVG